MIQLFRKKRRSSLMENPPAKQTGKIGQYLKYAIGEILLVVIGILIALYINDWSEERKDRAKEKAILKELHKDFKKNLQQFNEAKAIYLSSYDASLKFKYYINQPDLLAVQDSIGKYYFAGFNGVTYNPSNGIVESLISSGEYQLITNDSLRNYLISWKDHLADYLEEEEIFARLWTEKIEPFIIDEGDFTNLASPKNFRLITTPKFRNLTERHLLLLRNVIESIRDEPLEPSLNAIVRLSKVEDDE
jgi:hypothetical protein